MANEKLAEILMIGDRSGSMGSIRDDAIGGINAFRKEQQDNKDGECRVTFILFDDQYEVLHDNILIEDMPEMSSRVFAPRGATALFDAIGKTVNGAVERHEAMNEADRPGKVIVAIITDGGENRSTEFNSAQIQALVQEREAAGWVFAYLSADKAAMEHATQMGFQRKSVVQTGQDGVSVRAAYRAVSQTLSASRSRSRFGQIGAEVNLQSSYESLVEDEKDKE